MLIKLKEISVIFICPDHNQKYNNRKVHIESLLRKLNFNNIIHYKSNSDGYPKSLNDAYLEIFSKYKPPFLLLEDDVNINVTIPNILNLPDNTDAFYMGLSSGAGDKFENYDIGNSTFKKESKYLKVKNMLTTHSILYISNRYVNRIYNLIKTMPQKYYNDIAISRIQSEYNLYTERFPYFYQDEKQGGHEKATKIIIPIERIEGFNQSRITYVSSFINVNNITKDIFEKEYLNYFLKLVKCKINIILYLDENMIEIGNIIDKFENVKIVYVNKDELWIKDINKRLPLSRNTTKDNEWYIKLMNYKIFFMEDALKRDYYNSEYYAWIDFRIFHIFKNDELINNKFKLIEENKLDKGVYFPGNWEKKEYIVESINWRFLGGFFLLNIDNLNKLIKESYSILKSDIHLLTWEVNIWALIEFYDLFNFGWYKADHNETILDLK